MTVIVKPIISEKMEKLTEKLSRYGFIVETDSNKIQIKKEIEELYNVNVLSVNTMIVGGKNRVRYTKSGVVKGRSQTYKKAIVKLAEGETIDFFSNI